MVNQILYIEQWPPTLYAVSDGFALIEDAEQIVVAVLCSGEDFPLQDLRGEIDSTGEIPTLWGANLVFSSEYKGMMRFVGEETSVEIKVKVSD